jgi:hypothetical protein
MPSNRRSTEPKTESIQQTQSSMQGRARGVRRYLLTSRYGGDKRASESPRRGRRRASTGRSTERGRTIATATSSRKHDTFPVCARGSRNTNSVQQSDSQSGPCTSESQTNQRQIGTDQTSILHPTDTKFVCQQTTKTHACHIAFLKKNMSPSICQQCAQRKTTSGFRKITTGFNRTGSGSARTGDGDYETSRP